MFHGCCFLNTKTQEPSKGAKTEHRVQRSLAYFPDAGAKRLHASYYRSAQRDIFARILFFIYYQIIISLFIIKHSEFIFYF